MRGWSLFLLAAVCALAMSCNRSSAPTATLLLPERRPTFTPAATVMPPPTSTPVPSLTPTLSPTPSPGATFTPELPTAAFAPETVTIELTEEELAGSYEVWITDVGLSVETVKVTLADEKMAVLMKNVGIPIYVLEEFKMLGACTVLDGKLKFQLEKVVPDAPWVWVITPTADGVMAGMTKGVYVTQVEIVAGKMIIHGLKTAS